MNGWRRTIAYAKLGRTLGLDPDKWGPQGDAEAPQLLYRLARLHPDVLFVVGKHGEIPAGTLPPNVYDPWPADTPRAAWHHLGGSLRCAFCKTPAPDGPSLTCCPKAKAVLEAEAYLHTIIEQCDGAVIHVGQHGTSNSPIPMSNGGVLTKPHVWARNYGGYLIRGLNALGDRTNGRAPVTWICTDPRNYLKARDVKWPTGYDRIMSQFTYTRSGRHERYGDPRTPKELGFDGLAKPDRNGEVWVAQHTYKHADLELMILPDDWQETWGPKDFDDREPVGIASTSFFVPRDEYRRSWLIRRFVLDLMPLTPIFGKWDVRSLKDVEGFTIQQNTVAQFPELLGSWRCTLSLPPTTRALGGDEWSVAKPYQCWAARTVCFMLGMGDSQGWMLPSRHKSKLAHEVADGLWSIRDGWTDDDVQLARWLRVETPEEFSSRVAAVSSSRETWEWLVNQQLNLLRRRWDAQETERIVAWMLEI